jgi:hypothetical protein
MLTLELDDAQCTEAWILLKTDKLFLPSEVALIQFNSNGDSVSQMINVISKDTLLYIDSLKPNQTYRYNVTCKWNPKPDSQRQAASNKITVKTMDTTSHNFTFEMFTFGGQIGSSVLYDVAIINENNIWAVGEIWIADTSQLGYTKYNAVHWNGNQWELKRIYFPTVCGDTSITPYPAKAIFTFTDGQVWISSSGDKIAIIKDGIQINKFCLHSNVAMSINKIWGKASNDLYVVGYSGNIAHYNGTSWTKIASGTTLNINDIWGDYNQKTNQWEILAVASNILSSYEKEVLKINNNKIEMLDKTGINWTLSGIWFKSSRKYYAVGSGIYEKYKINDPKWHYDSLKKITDYHINSVRANDINDIFIVGAYGEILHFNGLQWKNYQTEIGLFSGSYKALNLKNNLLVCAGYESTKAKILIGRRY